MNTGEIQTSLIGIGVGLTIAWAEALYDWPRLFGSRYPDLRLTALVFFTGIWLWALKHYLLR